MSSTQQLLLGEGAGGGAVATYIEDVFSTYLYTGTGTNQTITNGINASTKGALFWIKCRSSAEGNRLVDTVRGPNYSLESNWNGPQDNDSNRSVTATTSGFTTGPTASSPNTSGENYVSWTFAKQQKFFDVQTATTNGSSSYGSTVPSMTITHSLGSVPGCVIVKRTDGTGDWYVWHRSLPALSGLAQTATYARLNNTGAAAIFGGNVNGTGGWIQATSTTIYLDAWFNTYEPGTFVVYIFAHDAGGFGLTGTDNVISCGSVTANGSGAATINLGYEPQWIMFKNTTSADSWYIFDNMRGLFAPTQLSPTLRANIANAEVNSGNSPRPSATGVSWTAGDTVLTASNTYIYIAIRRGPMKVPTSGTSVFSPSQWPGSGYPYSTGTQYTGFPVDSLWVNYLSGNSWNTEVYDRLRKASSTNSSVTGGLLSTAATTTESANGSTQAWFNTTFNQSRGSGNIYYAFGRAPSFFDEVCYTGIGIGQTIYHNLGVVPEMMIFKTRTGATRNWGVYAASIGTGKKLWLNATNAVQNDSSFVPSTPTATILNQGNADETDEGGNTYVAYLFATCAGVSKVGSYTGNASADLTINCGFTAGARFVLIKRTDSTGNWYVYDSSRGLAYGSEPYLLLNSTAAEVTGTNYIGPDSTGFFVNAGSPLNAATGATYIFLAIA